MPVKITISDSTSLVTIEDAEKDYDIPAPDLAALFYRAMLAMSYHPDLARSVFSDEVDV